MINGNIAPFPFIFRIIQQYFFKVKIIPRKWKHLKLNNQEFRDKKKPLRAFSGAPREIRTPVLALKGLRPGPLDDGGIRLEFYHILVISKMEKGWDCSYFQRLDAFKGIVAGIIDR